jgi:excisionase family DNA binding protein
MRIVSSSCLRFFRTLWRDAVALVLPERLLTARQIAEYIGVSPKQVYRWVQSASIPHFRISPRVIRFRLEDVEAWLLELRGDAGEDARKEGRNGER